jgi:uncharacterized repeat protein (TIGR01451 family)
MLGVYPDYLMINYSKYFVVALLIAVISWFGFNESLFAQTIVGTRIDNRSEARYQFQDGRTDSLTSNLVSVLVEANSGMRLTKSVSPTLAALGDTVRYTISVEDTSGIALSNIQIVDTIPEILNIISVSHGSVNGNTYQWTKSSLSGRGKDSAEIVAVIAQPLPPNTIVRNLCYGVDNAGTRLVSFADLTIRFRPTPQIDEIEISKTASKNLVLGGDTVVYSIRLANTGNTTLTNVVLKDTLPSELIFASVSSNATFNNNIISYIADSLSVEGIDSVTIMAIVKANEFGNINIQNRAYVQTDKTPVQMSDVTVFLDTTPVFEFTKLGPATAFAGDTVLYLIQFSNYSSNSLHDVVMVDSLDPLMRFVSGPEGVYDSINNIYRWTVSVIDSQSSGAYLMRVVLCDTISMSRTVINRAGFYSREIPPKSSQIQTQILIPAQLRIWKVVSSDIAKASDTLSYQISLSNISYSRAESVLVTDRLPDELIYLSSSPVGTYDELTHTVSWHENSIPAREIYQYRIIVKIRPDVLPGTRHIENIAITKWSTGEASSENDWNSNASVYLVVPYLQITKHAVRRIVEVGDDALYNICITNLSTQSQVNYVEIVDNIPTGFKYIKGSSFIAKNKIDDPSISSDELRWTLAEPIPPKSSVQLSYRLVVGAGALDGDGINKAQAIGTTPVGVAIASEIAQDRVEVKKGIFTDRGFVIGKVFYDDNENFYQDDNEEGIKGIELMTEEGTRVITGDDGKYSLPDMNAGEHVLRVRQETLPTNDELICGYGDFGNVASSRFVRLTESGVARVDFYVRRGKIAPVHLTQLVASIGNLGVQRITEPKNIVFKHEEGLSPIQIKGTQFEIGKAKLKPEAFPTLKAVADLAREYSDQIIAISGHTDSTPIQTKEFPSNKELSLARANAVKYYLIENHGIDSTRFSVVGFAETQPVASNSTKSGRSLNRRVEIEMGRSNDPFASYMKTVQFTLPINYNGSVYIKSIVIEDRLDTVFHYIDGSATIDGKEVKTTINQNRLTFRVDSIGKHFSKNLIYRATVSSQIEKIKTASSNTTVRYYTRDSVVTLVDTASTSNNIARTTRSKPVTFTLSGVLFDIGKATLKEEAMNAMKSAAEMLKTYPQATVVVEGHTDSKPIKTKEFPSNVALSNARAITVLNKLAEEFGISPSRLSSYGWGELKPIAANTTEDGRRANRRVEIKIYKEETSEETIREGLIDSSVVIGRSVESEIPSLDFDSSSESVSSSRFYLSLNASRQLDKQTVSTMIVDTLLRGLDIVSGSIKVGTGIDSFWVEKNFLKIKCNDKDSSYSISMTVEMNNQEMIGESVNHSFSVIRQLRNGKEIIDRSSPLVLKKLNRDR